MRGRFVRPLVVLVVAVLTSGVVRVASLVVNDPGEPGESFPAGKWVTVKPPLGLVPVPIVEYLTDEEQGVIRQVQRMVDALDVATGEAFEGYDVTWELEPAVAGSSLLREQRKAIAALDRAIAADSPFMRKWPLHIVVGRSQKWLRRVLERGACTPDLSAWRGVILLGAAVCGRHYVVSNITGFLWVVRPGQRITARMEARPEPVLAKVPYRLVERASTALAHEYTHIWRAAGADGVVRADEPAWFKEGFAEFWAGIAKVLASGGRIPYETQHVVRMRDFFDWAPVCALPVAAYRTAVGSNSACEYHVGVIAVEYLYARYSSLKRTIDAFSLVGAYSTFEEQFQAVFGISLTDFEREASRYVARVRRVELAQSTR